MIATTISQLVELCTKHKVNAVVHQETKSVQPHHTPNFVGIDTKCNECKEVESNRIKVVVFSCISEITYPTQCNNAPVNAQQKYNKSVSPQPIIRKFHSQIPTSPPSNPTMHAQILESPNGSTNYQPPTAKSVKSQSLITLRGMNFLMLLLRANNNNNKVLLNNGNPTRTSRHNQDNMLSTQDLSTANSEYCVCQCMNFLQITNQSL